MRWRLVFSERPAQRRRLWRAAVYCVTVGALGLQLSCTPGDDRAQASAGPPVKNVVLLVGDGMGIATITAGRVLRGLRDGIDPPEAASLYLDTLEHTALMRTYSADNRVTDSAAGATALVTGKKCQNYVLSLDASTERADENGDGDGQPLRTLLEIAESLGKATGLVTTTRVTHATPAAAFAHINERFKEQEIADQLLALHAAGRSVEVILGGGRRYFVPAEAADGSPVLDEEGDRGSRRDGSDLRPQFIEAGYTYVTDVEAFEAVDVQNTTQLLGLFESSNMEYEADRPTDLGGEPHLADMVRTAVEILSHDEDGFFLLVEGGRIDHALHQNQARRTLEDMVAFDEAVRALAESVDLQETLMVVTADHDHTMVISGSVPLGASAIAMGGRDREQLPYTSILFGNGPGYRADRHPPTEADLTDPDYRSLAAVPRDLSTHGGMDVPVYAAGPARYAGRVHGTLENTEIFDILLGAMEGRVEPDSGR